MKNKRTVTLADYKQLQKEVHKANLRIDRIKAKYGDQAWATTNLYSKLDNKMINAISPYSGNIRLRKSMNQAQLNAIRRATKEFLTSKTSTLTGIKQVRKTVQQSLKASLSDDDIQLTDKEVQALYRLVEDKDLKTTVDYVGASTLWRLIIDAKNKKMSERDWNKILRDYNINGNDLDLKNDLSRIFNEYIK